jgi:hypothetical protein
MIEWLQAPVTETLARGELLVLVPMAMFVVFGFAYCAVKKIAIF